ncbi:MAG: hypothetical protein JEZ04_05790 [Spirochaetales bacterium]|nr:hypothetical protein [Spirochaetales bacterium]
MKKTAGLILCIMLFFQAFLAGADSSWNTAVRHYRVSEDLKPHSMKVLSQTFNGKMDLEKTEELIFHLSYDVKGQTISELIQATEDGKDVTEQRKNENRNQRGRGGSPTGNSEGFEKNPLDPAVQSDLTAADTGTTEDKDGERCAVWEFRLKLNNNHDAVGKTWISLKTGAAVSLEYSIEPNFPFVEEMSIGMNYKVDSMGRWLMKEMRFKGRVNMIIMKKNFDAITSFSDYW